MKRIVFTLVFSLAIVAPISAAPQKDGVDHAKNVIAFFHNHPKAAATGAGQKALQHAASTISFAAAHPTAEQQWVNGSFATCVREQESGNGTTSQNIYEIQGSNPTKEDPGDYEWLYGVPRATQDQIAYSLYLKYGVQPWRPYDGC